MAALPKSLRLFFIACAGVGTFYVTAEWARSQRDPQDKLDEVVAAATPRTASQDTSKAAPHDTPTPESDALLRLTDRSRSIPSSKGNPFARLSWLPNRPPPPPPAPVIVALPPPKAEEPVTPPLPFTFVGMLARGKSMPEAYLAKGDSLIAVSVGEMLDDNHYRVDSLTADEVILTYLPMNVQQTLVASRGAK